MVLVRLTRAARSRPSLKVRRTGRNRAPAAGLKDKGDVTGRFRIVSGYGAVTPWLEAEACSVRFNERKEPLRNWLGVLEVRFVAPIEFRKPLFIS